MHDDYRNLLSVQKAIFSDFWKELLDRQQNSAIASFPRRRESTNDWIPDQVRYDMVAMFSCRSNNARGENGINHFLLSNLVAREEGIRDEGVQGYKGSKVKRKKGRGKGRCAAVIRLLVYDGHCHIKS